MSLMDVLPCIHCGSEEHTGNKHEALFGAPKPSPVPIDGIVTVKDAVPTHSEAADYGAFTSYSLTGTEPAFRLLSYDEKRSRAVVTVDTGSVFIGKKEQIYSTAPGFKLTGTVEIRNKQEVWCVPNAVACVVSVVNERWS